jgi:signal peptide peptidase SppA
MRFPRLLSKLYASPVMITPQVRASLERSLDLYLSGNLRRSEEHPRRHAYDGAKERADRVAEIYHAHDGLGILRISGVIDKHVSAMELDCVGGVDLDDVDHALEAARADGNVRHLLIIIDSPGGSATGVPETARRVASLAKEKPVTVFSDSMICSAAYFIAAAASEIIITESTDVGSIGVYMALLDQTRQLDMDGITVNLIKAGKYKAAGAPFTVLGDEERALFQSQVDQIYYSFTGAVKAGRPRVDLSALEGQTFLGINAIKAGLADDLALGLDEVMTALAR